MTREQMIAWFTLEGWAPKRGAHEAYLRGVQKDRVFVCTNVFASEIEQPVRVIQVENDRPDVDWAEISDDMMADIMSKILEVLK